MKQEMNNATSIVDENNHFEEEEEDEEDTTSTTTSNTTTNNTTIHNHHHSSRQWIKDTTQCIVSNGYHLQVGITTRDESLPIYDTPSKMYSSLRYKLHYKCIINLSQLGNLNIPNLLMCRITVIDDESGKEIKKDNKPIIDDSLISLKSTTNGNFINFEANHKIKFKSVSFHHNKSKWRLLLQLFSDSNTNINTPIYVIKSAPFQVYARRPKVSERDPTNVIGHQLDSKNKKKESNTTTNKDNTNTKKRKKMSKETKDKDTKVVEKKIKKMESFKKTLDLLVKYHSELDEEDKKNAIQLMITKFDELSQFGNTKEMETTTVNQQQQLLLNQQMMESLMNEDNQQIIQIIIIV
ncbi:hypothetical protein ABK040_006174 [Willaertia magna]